MFSKELTQPSLMTKSYKQRYMNTRRVLLAFKFPCDALPFVCLTIIILYKLIRNNIVATVVKLYHIINRENFCLLNVMESQHSKTCLSGNIPWSLAYGKQEECIGVQLRN
ncbi:hypothetical protein T4D_13572 [Trichinella pseudospiralis]|uniref:Uncharacterized protein n=1 Tax=Trichinella pseudospiralis TaxID=6337 RepID=A0A0V1FBK2_TRIPS|nr:hypothetical protein T4D_13572 [Trichinella pseudospiralis]